MVATHKYKETMTCRLAEGRPDSVLYTEDSGYQLRLKYTSILELASIASQSLTVTDPQPNKIPLRYIPTQNMIITHPNVSTNHVRVHAAHDREHGCYNSFTLCRGCTRYP
jgi:hypothetical protein